MRTTLVLEAVVSCFLANRVTKLGKRPKTCDFETLARQIDAYANGRRDLADTYCKCAKGLLPTCPDPLMVRTLDYKSCVCKPGTYSNGKGGCSISPTCSSPKVLSSDKRSCVCPTTMDTVGSTCRTKCRADQVRNSLSECACPSSKLPSTDGKSCVCRVGTNDDGKGGCATPLACLSPKVLSQDKKSCVCPSTMDNVGAGGQLCTSSMSTCQCMTKCGTGQVRDTSKACDCKSGFVDDGISGCIASPTCTLPRILSDDGKSCICQSTMEEKLIGGSSTCVCRSEFVEDGTSCKSPPTCSDPKILSEDRKSCVCPSTLDTFGNQCLTKCNARGQIRNEQGACTCAPGWNNVPYNGATYCNRKQCNEYPAQQTLGGREFHFTTCDSQRWKLTDQSLQLNYMYGNDFQGIYKTYQDCLDLCAADTQCFGVQWSFTLYRCYTYKQGIYDQPTGYATYEVSNGERVEVLGRGVIYPAGVPLCRSDQIGTPGKCKCAQGSDEFDGVCRKVTCADLQDHYTVQNGRVFDSTCGDKSWNANAYRLQYQSDIARYQGCVEFCGNDSQCFGAEYDLEDGRCFTYVEGIFGQPESSGRTRARAYIPPSPTKS